MNIFVLDTNPSLAVQYLCDAHVVKMTLETAQLLSTAYRIKTGDSKKDIPVYKISYLNHPCSIWARENNINYNWLLNYGFEISKEYTYRYEKRHASTNVFDYLLSNNVYGPYLDGIIPTKFELCMPDEYKVAGDYVSSYRNYYKYDKAKKLTQSKFKWTKREKPKWLNV